MHCMIYNTLWERRVMEEEQGVMAYFTSWRSCHYCESSDVGARFDAEC